MLIAARFSGSGSGKDLLSRATSLIAFGLLPFSSFPIPVAPDAYRGRDRPAYPALNNGCAATFENPLAGHSCDKQGSDIAKPGLLGLPGVVTLEWGPSPIRDVYATFAPMASSIGTRRRATAPNPTRPHRAARQFAEIIRQLGLELPAFAGAGRTVQLSQTTQYRQH
jgi:hypothetical protein